MNRPPNKIIQSCNINNKEFKKPTSLSKSELAARIGQVQGIAENWDGVSVDDLLEQIDFSLDGCTLLDQRNAGADITAKKLREIAETGHHTGVFGGEEVEKSAQAILSLYKSKTWDHVRVRAIQECENQKDLFRNEALEEAAVLAEHWGGAPPNPQGRRAALAGCIRDLKNK